jgi:hypothetical protein
MQKIINSTKYKYSIHNKKNPQDRGCVLSQNGLGAKD